MPTPAQQHEEVLERYRCTEGLCAPDAAELAAEQDPTTPRAGPLDVVAEPGAALARSRLRLLRPATWRLLHP